MSRTLTKPYLLTRLFLMREAVLSSCIEGAQASLVDLYAFEAELPLFSSPEQRGTYGKTRTTCERQSTVQHLEDIPLSPRLPREMHEILMESVRVRSMLQERSAR